MKHEKIIITSGFIKLDSFLKFCGAAETGGRAKEYVAAGMVKVNGEACLVRGKKLKNGDVVSFDGKIYEVENKETADP